MNRDMTRSSSARQDRIAFTLALWTVANAVVFFVAAILHLGVKIPLRFVTLAFLDPILPATIVEAVIGIALAVAATALFVHAPSRQQLTLRAYAFASIGTLFGLTVALLRGLRGPDIWVHFVMLGGLAAGFALLFAHERFRQGSTRASI